MRLEHLREQARRAFSWTSMSPERRGDDTIRSYSEQLEEDLQLIPEGDRAQYAARYESFMRSWLSSESNCASSFVAGPSNFPVERNRKRMNWAQAKYDAWQAWRQRAINGIARRIRRENAGDPLVEAQAKLERLKTRQEYMKMINATHRKYVKKPAILDTMDLSEESKTLIRNYVPRYSWEPNPFAPYELTNQNAEIRRMEKRVAELSVKEQLKITVGKKEFTFTGGQVVVNHEIDRVQIFHYEKPGRDVIDILKKNGFHWTPSQRCWQRQLTGNALFAIQQITGLKISC